jgi:hypothetical protein
MRPALVAAVLAVLLAGAAGADEGCVASPIACNVPVHGHLAAGCHDQLQFSSIGQYVRASLYPLSPSLTNTTITLIPADHASTAPLFTGGNGGAISLFPPVGPWTLTVGTRDAAAEGDYIVALACSAVLFGGASLDCVDQYISCGQTVEWIVTPESCRFTSPTDLAFASFLFYGIAGDTVSIEMESSDFSPRFGIYEHVRQGHPLVLSTAVTPEKDALEWKVPQTGVYQITARQRSSPGGYGRFKLTVHDCQSPACLPPALLREPADVVVPYGSRATLSADAIGLATLRYVWYDRSSVLAPAVGEGQRFTTPPITTMQWYGVSAMTPCGTADSRVVTVRPGAARDRPARH